MRNNLQIFIRAITHMVSHKPIEMPYVIGGRGYEYNEVFQVKPAIIDEEEERVFTLQVNFRKNGNVTKGRADYCDWTVEQFFKYIEELNDEDYQHLDRTLPAIEETKCDLFRSIAALGERPTPKTMKFILGPYSYKAGKCDEKTIFIAEDENGQTMDDLLERLWLGF